MQNTSKTQTEANETTAPARFDQSARFAPLPYTFRLPKGRDLDPYFGLTRPWYFRAESQGRLKMLRLREKGKARGVTLIRTADILRLIEEENS
jgi:hypothetical protein